MKSSKSITRHFPCCDLRSLSGSFQFSGVFHNRFHPGLINNPGFLLKCKGPSPVCKHIRPGATGRAGGAQQGAPLIREWGRPHVVETTAGLAGNAEWLRQPALKGRAAVVG